MITIEKALNIIGERTVDNHQMLKQARRQRRTEFVDIYGLPFSNELSSNNEFECRLFVSTDLEYWERFQFKLLVSATEYINPDGFSFGIVDVDDDGRETKIDLTPYLEEQHGSWISGKGGYFPSEEIGDEDADAEDFFDVLDACCILTAEGKSSQVNKILNAGTKIIRIDSSVPWNGLKFYPYIKYSTLNR